MLNVISSNPRNIKALPEMIEKIKPNFWELSIPIDAKNKVSMTQNKSAIGNKSNM